MSWESGIQQQQNGKVFPITMPSSWYLTLLAIQIFIQQLDQVNTINQNSSLLTFYQWGPVIRKVFLCDDIIMASCISFTHILQDGFTGTGAIIWLPQCLWSNPKGYGENWPVPTTKQPWNTLYLFNKKNVSPVYRSLPHLIHTHVTSQVSYIDFESSSWNSCILCWRLCLSWKINFDRFQCIC